MSTTIDERVVEMRFDNKHFETNVQGTLSTLDKLKQKLNLTGASKGLENISASANKVNMSGMANAIDTVHSRFSALEVMGVIALANITNSAVNAGKRMISALTIQPISDGWQEYEMTLNAVQTTMAGTGKTAQEVEKELEKLDIYADKTVYSTADMLNNLPKFTNAGVELEKATTAMIGIANATALAGGDAGKASIAFYNLGQAIGTGYLTRMDYNSINNAGIATMEWKNQMVEAAIAAGTLKKVGDDQYQAGKKTLTLQQLFIDGLQEQWATTDVMMKVFGDYGDETTEIGKKSYAAAQDIKTFSMMMDSLKATAGTGWKETWQIIFGGLDEAKEFWTGLSNFISKIITGMADFRNNLLKGALGKSFEGIGKTIKTITDPIKKTVDTVKNATDALKDMDTMVKEVIGGKWGNGKPRLEDLTEAGYNYYAIQNKVNETLGSSFRYSEDVINAQDKLLKGQEKVTDSTVKLAESEDKRLEQLMNMTDAELTALGMKPEQIEALRELKKYTDLTGLSVKEFVDNIDEIDGRWLLIEALKNAGSGLVGIFKAIGQAWVTVFPPMQSEQLFNLIAGFHKFSLGLRLTDKETGELTETGRNLRDTLKGIAAILDIVLTVVGGPIKIIFKLLTQLLSAFDLNILDITAKIGNTIYQFDMWLKSVLDFTAVFEALVPILKKFFKTLGETEAVKKFANYLAKAKEAIAEWFKGLKDISASDIISFFKKLGESIKTIFSNINKHFNGAPGDILSGLVNGLKGGAEKVITAIINLAKNIITKFKEVLGIHSPSTVFFAIGGFIIAGLIGGLLAGGTSLGDTVKGIANSIGDFFNNIDWNKVLTTGISAGLLVLAKKVLDITGNITAPLAGVGELLVGVGEVAQESAVGIGKILKQTAKVVKGFSKVLKGFAFKQRAQGVKELAFALLIIVGAFAILTMLDLDQAWEALGIITALALILVGLSFAINKISQASISIEKGSIKATGLKSTLISIGLALLSMATVVKVLGSMDSEQMKQGFKGLAGAVLALGALLAAYGFLIKGKGAQNMDKAGKMIRKMATTLLIMAVVVKLVSLLDEDELGKGAVFVAGFTAFVWALTAITKGADKNINKLGGTLVKLSLAMLLLVGVIALVSGMKWGALAKGAVFIAGFMAFVWGLVAITKIGTDKQIAKVGSTILGISAAMLIMVGVVKLISLMNWEALAKGSIGIIVLGGIVAGLLYIVKLIGPEAPKLAGTILAMSVAIGILAAVAIILSLVDLQALAKGVVAVGILGATMALMLVATKDAVNVKDNLIAMAVAIGVMAAAVALLSFIDWKKLLPATVALGTLMGMFAVIEAASKNITGAWGTLLIMTLTIGMLSGALYFLAQLPVEQTIAAAVSLSTLMLAMSAALYILSLIGTNIQGALLGALGLLALCVPLVAIAGILILMKDVNNAISSATALSLLLGVMAGVLVVLTVVGAFASAALIGIGTLMLAIVAIGGLIIAIGALMENYPQLQSFLDTGLSALIQLAGGIGEMIGAFIGGALTQISNSLPIIGTNLSLFMTNATPFITGAKLVDDQVLKGVASLAGAILLLTAADLISGVMSFLSGGTSFASLGTELSMFIINALPFITNAKLIDPNIMTGVKTLAETILILTAADVLQGLTSWLSGGNSLGQFGAQLGDLGTSLNTFVTNLGTFTESQVNTVNSACQAIKALAETAKTIPNEGGLWAAIVGDNSLATFGSYLPGLGTNLSSFVINLGTFTDSQVTTVSSACEAIKSLASAASEIPNEGGLWAAIVGDNSLASFGNKLPGLGTNLSSFVTNLGTFSDSQVTTVDSACSAIKALASAANTIPNEGGLWAKIAGDNSLATFGSKLPGLAKSIAGFVTNLGTFNDGQVGTVNAACDAITSIANLGKIDIKNTSSQLETLGSKMVSFAKKVKSFVDQLGKSSSDSINSAITKTKDLINMASSVANINVESLGTFGDSLKDFGKKGVSGFVKEFSGEAPKTKAKNAVKAMVQAGIDGAKDKADDVESKFEDIAESAVDEFSTRSVLNDAEKAGKDLVTGFANGIKNNKYLAENAGSAIGKAALKAAKEAIDSNSPSKEAMKLGNYFGQGLVIGIHDYESDTYNAGYGIADRAKDGLSRAISNVSALINSDMDTQPTIRPVLDLSDVESGVGSLNGMFNGGPSIGVMANLRAISSGMNAKNQNGTNSDVVSAIDKLRKDLGNVGRDTYNINGITYDDGSNITDAVRSLIRAAKVERRT